MSQHQQLAYKRSGTGPALVLVHGYFGGSDQWLNEINYFQSRFDVIAVDLPGFGGSAHIQAKQSIQGFAEAVIDLLDDLNVEYFALLGHSMGGMIAQEITFLAQERVAKLILYGTGPIGAMPNRFETHETSRQRLKQDGLQATVERISAQWFLQGSRSQRYRDCIEIGFLASDEAGQAGLKAMETWDGRGHISLLKTPVQIIWGEYDRSYGFSEQEQLWQGLPHCSIAIVPRASHLVHFEQPEIFLAVLNDFLICPDEKSGMT